MFATAIGIVAGSIAWVLYPFLPEWVSGALIIVLFPLAMWNFWQCRPRRPAQSEQGDPHDQGR